MRNEAFSDQHLAVSTVVSTQPAINVEYNCRSFGPQKANRICVIELAICNILKADC